MIRPGRTNCPERCERPGHTGVHAVVKDAQIEAGRQIVAVHGVPVFLAVNFLGYIEGHRPHGARVAIGARHSDCDAVVCLAAWIGWVIDVSAFIPKNAREAVFVVVRSHDPTSSIMFYVTGRLRGGAGSGTSPIHQRMIFTVPVPVAPPMMPISKNGEIAAVAGGILNGGVFNVNTKAPAG
jgi:hypothetical protein